MSHPDQIQGRENPSSSVRLDESVRDTNPPITNVADHGTDLHGSNMIEPSNR